MSVGDRFSWVARISSILYISNNNKLEGNYVSKDFSKEDRQWVVGILKGQLK
jgi:hypothetical protein